MLRQILLITLLNLSIIYCQIPASPFGLQSQICTQVDGTSYIVGAFISSPYFMTPFSDLYKNLPETVSKDKICRADGHCMLKYQMDVYETEKRVFDKTIPTCQRNPPTKFISYNGTIPGTLFTIPAGTQSYVRINNKLPSINTELSNLCVAQNRTGRPIVVHLHGSSSLAPFDGWAEDIICSEQTKDYVYPNQEAQTLWYHDHALQISSDNVYAGLAGMYIISSKIKDGGCGQPFNLQNIEERIMMLSDMVIDNQCQLLFDKVLYHVDDLIGDINTVNGVPFPLMPLEPKWYRFRFLNAAPSRSYKLSIKDSNLNTISHLVCQVFATDSGFKTQSVPFPLNGLLMGVGERYEVACDFSAYKGQTLYIWNDRVLDLPYFCYSHLIAKIVVSNTNVVNAPVFDVLAKPILNKLLMQIILSPAEQAQAQALANQGIFHRQMNFAFVNNQWRINGQSWLTFKIAASNIGINTWEIWKFTSVGASQHPIHMHLVDFFILRRDNGSGVNLVEPYEMYSGKDVVFAGPGFDIYVLVRFGAHKGDYMFHCHNLVHEDRLMIRAFRIQNARFSTRAQISSRFIFNAFLTILYSNYQYSDPLMPKLLSQPTANVVLLNKISKAVLQANFYSVFYPAPSDKYLTISYPNPWVSRKCN